MHSVGLRRIRLENHQLFFEPSCRYDSDARFHCIELQILEDIRGELLERRRAAPAPAVLINPGTSFW
jgi:hypothetical protein